jgi:hypothetical protein
MKQCDPRWHTGQWLHGVLIGGELCVTTEAVPPDPNAERVRVVKVTEDAITVESVEDGGDST